MWWQIKKGSDLIGGGSQSPASDLGGSLEVRYLLLGLMESQKVPGQCASSQFFPTPVSTNSGILSSAAASICSETAATNSS